MSALTEQIPADWSAKLKDEFHKDYFQNLSAFVSKAYASETVFPPREMLFSALDACRFAEVKVLILGQDPYHGLGQANGLSFSVSEGVVLPPSLKNIYKALYNDLGILPSTNGDLSPWAKQGVLLLNAMLTVRSNEAGSHQNKGWEQFTDALIRIVSEQQEHVVFMLWGSYAQQKAKLINSDKHLILKAVHPSPLSAYRGFLTAKHFSLANNYLAAHGHKTINWQLPK